MNNSDDNYTPSYGALFNANGEFIGLGRPSTDTLTDSQGYYKKEPPDSSILDDIPSDTERINQDTGFPVTPVAKVSAQTNQVQETHNDDKQQPYQSMWDREYEGGGIPNFNRDGTQDGYTILPENLQAFREYQEKTKEADRIAREKGELILGFEIFPMIWYEDPTRIDPAANSLPDPYKQGSVENGESGAFWENPNSLLQEKTDASAAIDVLAAAEALNELAESEAEERPMVQPPAKNEPDPTKFNLLKIESDKPTPYITAHKFLEKCELFSMNRRLYIYDGVKYKHLTEDNAESMILRECRADVEAVGTPSFVQSVYRFIVMEKTNPDQEQSDAVQTNDEIVSFANGVFHLESRKLLPHDKKWITLYNIQCNYIFEDLPCPNFEQFLIQASGGDYSLINRIWQMIGCLLVPHPGRRPFFVLQGAPRSGKSMLGRIIKSLFNPEAVLTLDINAFGRQFAPAALMDKQINISQETENKPLDAKAVSVFKAFTGGDSQTMDVKNKDMVQFSSKATFVLITNHALVVKGGDDALADRAVVIPFRYSVPQEQVDVQLEERIRMEASAIVSRGLRAYLAMIDRHEQFAGNYQLNEVTQSGGFNQDPQVSLDDMMIDFFRSSIVQDVSGKLFTEDAYTKFIEQYTAVPSSEFAKMFKKYAKESGSIPGRERRQSGANPQSCYKGIRLVDKQGLI